MFVGYSALNSQVAGFVLRFTPNSILMVSQICSKFWNEAIFYVRQKFFEFTSISLQESPSKNFKCMENHLRLELLMRKFGKKLQEKECSSLVIWMVMHRKKYFSSEL